MSCPASFQNAAKLIAEKKSDPGLPARRKTIIAKGFAMLKDNPKSTSEVWAEFQALVDEGYAALDLSGLTPMEKVDRIWEHFDSPPAARTPITVLVLRREMKLEAAEG